MRLSVKWCTIWAAAAALFWRQDAETSHCLLGAVAAGVLSKALKSAINQPRPPRGAAALHDPGFPSSHAVTLAFIAAYVWQASGGGPLRAVVVLTALAAAGVRVARGLHSGGQVAGGLTLGVAVAVAWREWVGRLLLPALEVLWGRHRLLALGVAASGALAVVAWGRAFDASRAARSAATRERGRPQQQPGGRS